MSNDAANPTKPQPSDTEPKIEPLPSAKSATLAILLLVPAPTIGVSTLLFGMPDHWMGKAVAFSLKIWIAALPLIWTLYVDRRRIGWPKLTGKGMPAGFASGIVIFLGMLGAFYLVRPYIDLEPMQAKAKATGFDSKTAFLAMFVYIIVVNSLLEEYVWRWFVTRKFEAVFQSFKIGGVLAVVCSGLCFTIHHVIALAAWVPPGINVLASFGVFLGGTTWSFLYHRYRSVWPGYVSHVFADIAILIMGWQLLFT